MRALTMDAAKMVTATFILNTYPLTVTKTGNGSGMVTSSVPGGINCGNDCGETLYPRHSDHAHGNSHHWL